MNPTPELFLALGIGLLLGGLCVYLLQRRLAGADRERAEQLASELEETREELDEHREEVGRHFRETSQLFRSLTEQYTRLYAHLAEGAREFCTDDVPALGRGFDGPLLGANGDGAEGEPTREAISAAVAAAAAVAKAGDAAATKQGDGPAAASEADREAGSSAGSNAGPNAGSKAETKADTGTETETETKPGAAPDPHVTVAQPAEPTLAQPRPAQTNGGSPPLTA